LKNTFFVSITIAEKDVFKKSVKEAFQGIKTRFLSWRKQYAKLEIQKQVNLKDQLNDVQRHFAIFTMVFLGIGCLIFTPLCAIFIFIWLRIYLTYSDKRPLKFETILLLIASIVIMVIALLEPFLPNLRSFFNSIFEQNSIWTNIAQFSGLLISSVIYINYLLKPILQERRKRKIEDLKKASADLKKQHADLKKEHDDLKQSTKYLLKKKRELEKKAKETKPEKQ
jgi:amino acid permease